MATRSTIALEFADGSVGQVYCHWDGYLDHNGKILQKHWLDPFKVRSLIDLGDLSSLGTEIGIQHPFDRPLFGTPAYKDYDERFGEMCMFYGRDRGEVSVPKYFVDYDDYVKNHQYEEYEYILRNIHGVPVWFVSKYGKEYIPLEVAIHQELIADTEDAPM